MLLEVKHLTKKYSNNDFYSLDDVSFNIDRGEIVGLIGKNGAGKSTLLKLIAKSIRPSNGKVLYKGKNIYSSSNMLEEFGILIETVFYPDLSVIENLEFYLDIHQKNEYRDNIKPTLELLDLWNRRNDYPSKFSYGMKQRLALSIALITKPEILLLDEPFVGLDPTGVNKLIGILKNRALEKQVTMIISSHQLGELESLCNRFMYIDNGKLTGLFDNEKNHKLIIKLPQNIKADEYKNKYIDIIEDDKLILNKDITKEELNEILFLLSKDNLIEDISLKNDEINKYFQIGETDEQTYNTGF